MTARATEAERIQREYAARDAGSPGIYSWDNPGYAWHISDLEWQLLTAMRRHGATFTGARTLEVGCGFGTILSRFLDWGAASAAGVDLSEHRVDEARRRCPNLDVQVADAAALPFEDDAFDVVTQFVCLSSVLDAGVRREICAEMWRVCRPGGLVISYDMRPTPGAMHLAGRWYARLRGVPKGDGSGTPTTPIAPGELRAAFPGAELRTVSLNIELAGPLAGRSPLLARLAAGIPAVRTHLLAVARKP